MISSRAYQAFDILLQAVTMLLPLIINISLPRRVSIITGTIFTLLLSFQQEGNYLFYQAVCRQNKTTSPRAEFPSLSHFVVKTLARFRQARPRGALSRTPYASPIGSWSSRSRRHRCYFRLVLSRQTRLVDAGGAMLQRRAPYLRYGPAPQ